MVPNFSIPELGAFRYSPLFSAHDKLSVVSAPGHARAARCVRFLLNKASNAFPEAKCPAGGGSDYTSLPICPAEEGVMLSSPTSSVSITLPPETRRRVLLNLLKPIPGRQLTGNVSEVTEQLQRCIPESCEGELSRKVAHILESSSISLYSLSAIFGLAAYFASNNKLTDSRMDIFLQWVMDQKYTEYLKQFLQIDTPTIHAFAPQILKSAVRIKNTEFLTTLMDLGVQFDSIMDKIILVGNVKFIELALSRVNPTCFDGHRGVELFHLLVERNHFDPARTLVTEGVNVNAPRNGRTPLWSAVYRKDVHAITFLLELGAMVNKTSATFLGHYEVPLARAVLEKEPDIVATLLKHNAHTSCQVNEQDLMEWSLLHCRTIYRLLQEHVGAIDGGFTIGDLIDAANESNDAFQAYLRRHHRTVSKQQLEQALAGSIQPGYLRATTTLLEHGVSSNCPPNLGMSPLRAALSQKQPRTVCELLIKHRADVNEADILKIVVRKNDFKLLQIFIDAGVNLEQQGIEALVEAAELGQVSSATFLLHLGVDVNAPGLEMNPLQAAAREGQVEMLELLLVHGADINALAHLNGGRTALQAALESETLESAWLLLHRGADVSAPPALISGATALEAICHNRSVWPPTPCLGLCNYLLDSNAPVNRPNGRPSSALHGAIERDWDGILARMLEPQRNAIINHMWCDKTIEEDEDYIWEPRTPTQLAAGGGKLEAVKMLLARGADINEDPAYRFGRTTLQAATSSGNSNMDLVKFLLDKGADVHAKPAVYGGITALQGAAISGDIMLVKLLIDKGAGVNESPSYFEGRYAIEGAAEHGRLDMVQLLLNAGAKGNKLDGMGGFQVAIELATKNGHFAVANLLKSVTRAEA